MITDPAELKTRRSYCFANLRNMLLNNFLAELVAHTNHSFNDVHCFDKGDHDPTHKARTNPYRGSLALESSPVEAPVELEVVLLYKVWLLRMALDMSQ